MLTCRMVTGCRTPQESQYDIIPFLKARAPVRRIRAVSDANCVEKLRKKLKIIPGCLGKSGGVSAHFFCSISCNERFYSKKIINRFLFSWGNPIIRVDSLSGVFLQEDTLVVLFPTDQLSQESRLSQ
jgi:hypothetical protein